jgi:3-hydroxyacyl-CoA dehydrogenase
MLERACRRCGIPAKHRHYLVRNWGSKLGPCRRIDQVGLDTVALIESHYIAERSLDPKPRDFLDSQYIKNGKLGEKWDLGVFIRRLQSPSRTIHRLSSIFSMSVLAAAMIRGVQVGFCVQTATGKMFEP